MSMHPLAEVVADHLNQLSVDLQEELTSGVDLSDLVGNVDTTVAVGSFEPAATAELAAAAGMPDLAPAIQEATGGDPLFAVEALFLANEAGPAAAVQALAGSVRDIVLDGIHRGGPGVESFLRLAATFGVVFDLDDVAVLGSRSPEELAHHADRALAAGLISVRRDSSSFASSVVRNVLHASTPPPIRVSRHRRAAVGAATPEARARHLDAGGRHADAADAWAASAEMARRRFAHRDADRLWSAALASSERDRNDRRSAELLIFRAGVRVDLGPYGDARADLEDALQRARVDRLLPT